MTHPTTHYLQFLGIVPLAIGIAFYLTKTKSGSVSSLFNKTCRLERESIFKRLCAYLWNRKSTLFVSHNQSSG